MLFLKESIQDFISPKNIGCVLAVRWACALPDNPELDLWDPHGVEIDLTQTPTQVLQHSQECMDACAQTHTERPDKIK